jgi:hypothetical protein
MIKLENEAWYNFTVKVNERILFIVDKNSIYSSVYLLIDKDLWRLHFSTSKWDFFPPKKDPYKLYFWYCELWEESGFRGRRRGEKGL